MREITWLIVLLIGIIALSGCSTVEPGQAFGGVIPQAEFVVTRKVDMGELGKFHYLRHNDGSCLLVQVKSAGSTTWGGPAVVPASWCE